MKITIKTTQQKVFQFDVDGTETIGQLKAKIEESQGHAASAQKIIYSGKILADDKTIESCGIKEKDFLVLMVSKPKPAPAASTSAPAPAAAAPAAPVPAAPAAPAAEAPAAPAQPEAPAATPAADAPAADAPAPGDDSGFLSGPRLQAAIANMVEMGFPRDQVLRALRASFNNPDRAVEYLMNGIPAHLEAEQRPAAEAAAPAAAAPAAAAPAAAAAPTTQAQAPAQPQNLFQLAHQQQQNPGAGLGAGAGAGGVPPGLNLEALRDNPQIQQLRRQMAEHPDLIVPLIQQMAQANPAIAQIMAQNPEALTQLLGIELGEGEDEQQLPPGAQVISVTAEERAAIERLEALGFPRQAVLEAYFACDKNEELAANYLFEGGFD
ncbi:hypothetical protein D9619_001854 [Psilocybe cf. subviscida]|uniref:UV excision repair protein RAD23 n=1 Tax=Psilocybe cf. subviscida TaxID=2480587 RepID=A0A8H5F3B4_9AGAR|nr:hypothetical protein D9619_001854 [Psilocybe cf. subviscida]